MDFHPVEANLRQSFRILASGRAGADIFERDGISVASLGAKFQMFNAAFLNRPVESQAELESRIETARRHFLSRRTAWAFWICEDWLDKRLLRGLTGTCVKAGLRLSSELPGMSLDGAMKAPRKVLPEIDFRRVDSATAMNDFRAIGSVSFHVPLAWFREVFEWGVPSRDAFVCHVGYLDGVPVATSGSVRSDGVVGIYNIATAPEFRGRGIAEAMTRRTVDCAFRAGGPVPVVLQSTSHGLRIYQKLGFETVTRILVYNSL